MRTHHGRSGVFAQGLAVLGIGTVLMLIYAPVVRSDTPYEQAKGVVQEMLGEAIMADVLATSPQEKALAQERLGYAIMNQARIVMGERHLEQFTNAERIKFADHPGRVQEMLGMAIVDAAVADSPYDQGRTQEVLGLMIVNRTLLELGGLPVGMGGETGTYD